MRDLVPKEILRSDLLEHPAVKAWSRLQPQSTEPLEIQTLKRNKSAVYRLAGVGPEDSSVIAKYCRTTTALTEAAVYQEALPRLPLPCLRFYGILEDNDPNYRCFFIEDAVNKTHFPHPPEHQPLISD